MTEEDKPKISQEAQEWDASDERQMDRLIAQTEKLPKKKKNGNDAETKGDS